MRLSSAERYADRFIATVADADDVSATREPPLVANGGRGAAQRGQSGWQELTYATCEVLISQTGPEYCWKYEK